MQAREKKIERMNTMPNIKVAQEEMIAMERISPSSPKISRFRDTFLQADGSPKATTSLSSWMRSPSSSFGTFQLNSKSSRDVEGLPSMKSASYVDQLRSTALLMMDLDKRSKTEHRQTTTADIRPKTGRKYQLEDMTHVQTQQTHLTKFSLQDPDNWSPETDSEAVVLATLMRVDEEEEDNSVEVNKSPRYSSRQNLLNERDTVPAHSRVRPKSAQFHSNPKKEHTHTSP